MAYSYATALQAHYERSWRGAGSKKIWPFGPIHEMPEEFGVGEFAPSTSRPMWTYATLGMSLGISDTPIEIHLFSPVQEESLIELLTVIAHYHRTGSRLDIGHTVNFGRSWLPESKCTFGLLSRPYLDGPELEEFTWNSGMVHCLWLIPITEDERAFKKAHGLEDLEALFEEKGFDYIDPLRPSVTET